MTQATPQPPLDHARLVEIARRWLLGHLSAHFVLTEYKRGCDQETPDAIGFRYGETVLVECKTSRADFLRDRQKLFRKVPGQGMGSFRYYLCPKGLIRPEELPERWGLLYALPSGLVRPVVHPLRKIQPHETGWDVLAREQAGRFPERNVQAEVQMMHLALKFLETKGCLHAVAAPWAGDLHFTHTPWPPGQAGPPPYPQREQG